MRFGTTKVIDIGDLKIDRGKVKDGLIKVMNGYFPCIRKSRGKFSGKLDSFWEHGIIKGNLNIELKNKKLFIEISVTTDIGKFSILLAIIAIIPGTGWIGNFSFALFMFRSVTYLFSRNLPGKYVAEAVDAFIVKLEMSPEEFTFSTPVNQTEEAPKHLPAGESELANEIA